VDFAQSNIFIRSAKGGKDRTGFLPQFVLEDFTKIQQSGKIVKSKISILKPVIFILHIFTL
jgi:hypothetical protein